MDIPGFESSLLSPARFPLRIQLGGFERRSYPFESRGEDPHSRSFSIQAGKAVLMGRPIQGVAAIGRQDGGADPQREPATYPPALDNVTQLLLLKQSAGKSLDQVTDLYRKQGNDVRKTADELGVAAEKYSPDKVEAAIDGAKAQVAKSATDKAADSAGKAVGSLFGR